MENLNFSGTLKKNITFLLLYCIFLVAGGYLLVFHSKAETFLWINGFHNSFMDTFFRYFTNVGDGLFTLAIVIILLFINARQSVNILSSFLASGLIIQILKYYIDTPRPITYFTTVSLVHYVPGVEVYNYNSFPSGHTASAFSLFFLIAFIIKKKYWGAIFFFIALTVGWSRIYLAQHFLVDVYFGSAIGLLTAIILFRTLNKIKFLDKLEGSVISYLS